MQYFPTRDQDGQPRAGFQQVLEQGSGTDDLLEVIEQQEECLSRNQALTVSTNGCAPASCKPNSCAMVEMTRLGSVISASDTKQIPSAKRWRSWLATWMDRRVLPMPPTPIKVSNRTSGRVSRVQTVLTSCSRPTRGVKVVGT